MSVVAEFRLPHAEFALADTFERMPNLVVEIEHAVATPTGRVFPHLWAVTPDGDPPLAADPTVESVRHLAGTTGGRLYAVEWTADVRDRVAAVLDLDVTVLRFVGDECGWHAEIRGREHERLSAFQELLTDAGVEMELERVRAPRTPGGDNRGALTAKQREAVATAAELGFYEVPRETTMAGLAERLGISQQALSKRLRRAHERIVGETVGSGGRLEPAAGRR